MPSIRAADVGRRATVGGYGKGTVRFVGTHVESGSPKVGVELDNPDGKNNGKIKVIMSSFAPSSTWPPFPWSPTLTSK